MLAGQSLVGLQQRRQRWQRGEAGMPLEALRSGQEPTGREEQVTRVGAWKLRGEGGP